MAASLVSLRNDEIRARLTSFMHMLWVVIVRKAETDISRSSNGGPYFGVSNHVL